MSGIETITMLSGLVYLLLFQWHERSGWSWQLFLMLTAAVWLTVAAKPPLSMVGVENGVVVGVDDFFPAAFVQRIAGAHRSELLEGLGITLEVFGAVAAHLVQDQHAILLQVVDE